MTGLSAGLIGSGATLTLAGGFDLLIHTRRPDLGIDDPSLTTIERHLAARARAARRLAPMAIVVGAVLLCCGVVVALI